MIFKKTGFLLSLILHLANASCDPVSWTFGVGGTTECEVEVGEALTFQWGGGTHNVVRFPNEKKYEDCDFSDGEGLILVDRRRNGDEICGGGDSICEEEISFQAQGTWFVGCSVGSHCAGGNMKLKVTVVKPGRLRGLRGAK